MSGFSNCYLPLGWYGRALVYSPQVPMEGLPFVQPLPPWKLRPGGGQTPSRQLQNCPWASMRSVGARQAQRAPLAEEAVRRLRGDPKKPGREAEKVQVQRLAQASGLG